MTNKELIRRIETLEQQVRDLQARPVYVPIPYQPIQWPQPQPAWPVFPNIRCATDTTGKPWTSEGTTAS